MAKSGRLELGDNIYRHYRSIFNHCDVFSQQRNRNRRKTQNQSYYAVHGHPRSSRSISIESPYATCYQWLIVTDILSRTVSEISQLIVQIWILCVFEPPFGGLRDNVRCLSWAHWKARCGLPIGVNWSFSLGDTAEALRAKIDRISVISLQRGHFKP